MIKLAKRAEYRATYTAKDVPPFLGPPAPPPPDLAALPPSAGRLMRAIFIALGHLFGSSQAEHEEKVLFGLAASKGVYEGPARRVSGPSEFGRIAKGDVLVTELTTEAFNILLPLLGGIVTDNGGLLSHAAIVSRECIGELLARAKRPGASPTASVFVLMEMPARLQCSDEEGRPLRQGARYIALWLEGRGLGDAARDGLPVPPGVALSGDLVQAVASGDEKAIEKVAKAVAALSAPFAVRSSAVDEDGAAASFAGQHLTVLNVHSLADVPGAIREVWWSANSGLAITYRQRVGLFTRPSVGVVVQTLLNPAVAGVMFTEHPGHWGLILNA